MSHKDLRLGQIVYILVFYNILFSWFLSLDGFQFNFLLRDSENCLYQRSMSFLVEAYGVNFRFYYVLEFYIYAFFPDHEGHLYEKK